MRLGVTVLLALAAAAQASAQDDPGGVAVRQLSLQHAIDLALADNPDLAIAEAQRDIAGSYDKSASGPLWPRLDLNAGFIRSNDPVFVFGTKLRQGRFTAADLDLQELNNPNAINDWSTAFNLRWSLLDPTVWAGRSSAKNRSDAADWAAVRTREATVLITRSLYYRAQSATAQLEAANASVEAAESTLDSFSKRAERGLLTEADLLQAEAELAAARAQQAAVASARVDALQDLGLHLGWSSDTLPAPSDTLVAPAAPTQSSFNPEERSDLRALAATVEATGSEKKQKNLAYIPAVDLLAQYATYSSDPFAFDGTNWTVGVMMRWNLFSGFGRSADGQRAELEKRIATIEYEQALRDAKSELDQAERAVRSARLQVDATQTASAAADAGRRLMRRRFDEGLATATDLLQAESRATVMRQGAIDALASYHMAVARLDFVRSQSN
jgi:outer membrane protein TolC